MTCFDAIEAPGCGCGTAPDGLMHMPEALARALACTLPVTQTERLPLHHARGRVLATSLRAGADMPRFDCAAMDGYALRLAERAPRTLPVNGSSAAGQPPGALAPGTAMRIYTGAPLPQGADTVVMQEDTERDGDLLTLRHLPARGAHIRHRAEETQRGEVTLAAGRRLDPLAIGICAGAGADRIEVLRRPRVAVLLTGDELRAPGKRLEEAAIWDVNGPMIGAALGDVGCEGPDLLRVPDDPLILGAALLKLARRCDMIVTSGGASVGDRDPLADALDDLGAQRHVAGIAIKPGKPTTVASISGTPLLALPGNPLAAFTIWHLLGRPMAARLAGDRGTGPACRHVRVTDSLDHRPGRCEYRAARTAGYGADGLENVSCPDTTQSARLSQAQGADGFVIFPADCEGLNPGDLAEFLPFH